MKRDDCSSVVFSTRRARIPVSRVFCVCVCCQIYCVYFHFMRCWVADCCAAMCVWNCQTWLAQEFVHAYENKNCVQFYRAIWKMLHVSNVKAISLNAKIISSTWSRYVPFSSVCFHAKRRRPACRGTSAEYQQQQQHRINERIFARQFWVAHLRMNAEMQNE